MSNVASIAGSAPALSWDGEGRRVSGGALAPDLNAAPGEELTVGDFLSALNPLQHIPVVSSVYRWISGDTIKPAARIVGGAIYGGPLGLVTAAFNAIVEQVKGADLGAQAIALVLPDRAQPDAAIPQVAAAGQTSEEKDRPTPETDRAEANLAALQQFAADLRSATPAPPAESKPAADPTPAMPPQPGQARNLAFYQAHAGRRLSTGDTSRYSLPQQPAGAALMHASPVIAVASNNEPASKTEGAAEITPGESPPAVWFSSAMLRGLDRYRAMQQVDKAAPQIDLSH